MNHAGRFPALTARHPFYVVGMGASAGAVGALRTVFGQMPATPGFACVVVVHLSPEHESHLVDLLQSHSRMPVEQVQKTTPLEPNHVYVIPPNANIDAIDTHLRLSALEELRAARAPIDHFLRTLAASHDAAAVGVILTGTGSDGALGLRLIKEHGGLTISQDPDEAEYDSMPRSAIATGMVDLVLPLRDIGGEIQRFCATKALLPPVDADDEIDADDDAVLAQILRELRLRTKQELSIYKRRSILPRIGKRMQLRQVDTLRDYLDVLGTDQGEARALVDEVLLSVAEFFREPEAFVRLERDVFPRLFDRKAEVRDRLRVWSIGCSTGEEAYSLAMLLVEEAARRDVQPHLQIFASDSSDVALARAREGIYAHEVTATVSAARLERFFTREGGHYRVRSVLRDIVVFAEHDLFTDPPYSHLDLIVCRDSLSSLQPEVRRGVLALFHCALEPDGLLLLGADDEVDLTELFAPEHEPIGLFRKRNGQRQALVALPALLQSFRRQELRGGRLGAMASGGRLLDIAGLHRRLVERYAPPSVLVDASNTVVHYSPHAARYLQIQGGELTHDLLGLVREPLRASLEMGLELVRRDARSWASEPLTLQTASGRRRIVLRVEPAPAREARALAAVIFDELRTQPYPREELLTLNDENRLEELAQVSRDMQHLLESTGIATLFLDRDLRIVRYTPQFGELFNVRQTDRGRPLTDLTHDLHYGDLAADAGRALGHLVLVEREVLAGSGRWYLARLLPYRKASGAIDGVVMTLVDITDRKEAEESLRETDRRKDEFLALLAHELRNPLAPITSGVELLKAAGHDPRIVEQVTAMLERQSRQLVRLVDDLLDVSRISGARLHLRRSSVRLADIVHDASEAARPLLERRGHELTIELPAEPIVLDADAARMTQVVANLLSNAARYTLTAGRIEVRVKREGDEAVVRVSDTGVGISETGLTRMFEMFYQSKDPRLVGNTGLGVGLTLARSLVEMHGGTISAASPGVDRGSTFTVRLPIARPEATPVLAAPDHPKQGLDGHRVLIVDDNADAARTLCMVVQRLGRNDVHMVSSGAHALEAAAELRPDIAFLDLKMPGIDGYEVARRIRAQPWGREMLLVALTGWGQQEHKRLTEAAGFDWHLTKPADRAALEGVLAAGRGRH